MKQFSTTLPTEAERHKLLKSPLNGEGLILLFEAGLIWLTTNQEYVNALNVFPVPDGDTGTNMVLTMQAGFAEADSKRSKHAGEMAKTFAHGALMGARGNSGVILSQIWRGFSRALDGHATVDPQLLTKALQSARDTAYRGVVRPVEGTILTVLKDMTTAAEGASKTLSSLSDMLVTLVEAADVSVQNTPNLLPQLKDAGVVDSGGMGLFYIFEGMLRMIQGLSLDTANNNVVSLAQFDLDHAMEQVEEGQDYEVVIDFEPNQSFLLEQYYQGLEEIGVSIQVGEGEGIYRMHIHTELEKRYEPIEFTESHGIIKKVYMENLQDQMNHRKESEIKFNPVHPGEIAVVAVSPGPGLSRIFASLGVAAVVEGGQTMNPSVKDLVAAFEDLPTDKVIILPNNKNIILAAQNASKVSVKQVGIIPTRNTPQGFASMFRLMPDGDFDEVVESMTEAISEVHTAEVTTATRTAEIEGVKVKKGEVIVLYDGKLILSEKSLDGAVEALYDHVDMDEFERVTLFYGEGMNQSAANSLADKTRESFEDLEVEVHDGGQPHYQYIIAFE
ncbi:MAG TPA: DAK2 domain-containing protein [Anaerolineaceae bacterium]|nr:DAK2 domain-containing protein [Anaerolineaceae bacterium]